jgi:tight adherence protein B
MSITILRIFILLLLFAAVFIASQFMMRSASGGRLRRKAVNQRLEMIRRGADRETIMGELRKNNPNAYDDLPEPLSTIMSKMQRIVFAASVPFTAIQALVGMAFATILVFVLSAASAYLSGIALTFGKLQIILLFAVAVSFGLPLLVLRYRAQKRRQKMEAQFPVAIDIFVRALRSGHPISSAIDLLTKEMEDPIGSEFGLVSDEVSYGAELTSALYALAERWDLDDIRMFVVSLSVQSETGGNLAEILENLSEVIRARAQMFLKVRALSSEGRMTAWMLTALPIFAFVTTFLASPQFYLDVADDFIFKVGAVVLLLLYATGAITIRKMIDLKV